MDTDRRTRIGWSAAAGLFVVAVLVCGCSGPGIQMMSTKRYSPRPPSYPVDLYSGDLQTPHEDVALLDSICVEYLTTDTRKALVEDLRTRARNIGADAVTDVVMLIAPQRGWVPDPQTPFNSWRQGWRDTYFLRGRAVRFKPLRIEMGDRAVEGERFDFGEGERPVVEQDQEPEIEIYEFTDEQGRRGYRSRRVQPGRSKPVTLDRGED